MRVPLGPGLRLGPLVVLAAILAAAGCESKSSTGPEGDTSAMTAVVDGESFSATTLNVVEAGGNALNVVGTTPLDASRVRIIGLVVRGITGPGTYDLGPDVTTSGATYTENEAGAVSQWSTFHPTSSGSLTLTTLTASRVAGTFQFVGVADPGTAAAGTVNVTNGTFDLRL